MKKVLLATIGLLSFACTLSAYHGGYYQGAYQPGGYSGYPAQDYYYYQGPDQPSNMYYYQGGQGYNPNYYQPGYQSPNGGNGMYNQNTQRMYFRDAANVTETQTQPSWGWGSNLKPATHDRVGDEQIAKSIRTALKTDYTLSDSARNIQVSVNSGKVTLNGVVNSDAEKAKIEAMAKQENGATSVINNLKVTSTRSSSRF